MLALHPIFYLDVYLNVYLNVYLDVLAGCSHLVLCWWGKQPRRDSTLKTPHPLADGRACPPHRHGRPNPTVPWY